jgi:hypothetical protein
MSACGTRGALSGQVTVKLEGLFALFGSGARDNGDETHPHGCFQCALSRGSVLQEL